MIIRVFNCAKRQYKHIFASREITANGKTRGPLRSIISRRYIFLSFFFSTVFLAAAAEYIMIYNFLMWPTMDPDAFFSSFTLACNYTFFFAFSPSGINGIPLPAFTRVGTIRPFSLISFIARRPFCCALLLLFP